MSKCLKTTFTCELMKKLMNRFFDELEILFGIEGVEKGILEIKKLL